MKRVLIVLLLTILLSSCKEEQAPIPLLIYDMRDDYMEDFEGRIISYAEGKIPITTYDSQQSQVIQNEYIEDLIEDSPLLIVNPVDRLGAYTIIEKANVTQTPIIFINREPLYTDMIEGEQVYYIGANPIESAEIQASIVMDVFGNNPGKLNGRDLNDDNMIQAIILKGQIGHQDAELRTEYVIKSLEDSGYQLDILAIEVADFDMETAQATMSLLLEEFGNQIEVVIANNDAMAIGAINALIEQEYFIDTNENGIIERDEEPWIPVIGIDGLEASIELIDLGYLYGTVINDSQSMAEAIIELSQAIINNQDVTTIPFDIVDGMYIWIDYQPYTNEE